MVVLKNIYGEVVREFPELDTLAGADLSFQDLREVDFSGMELHDADLYYADLEGAIFDYADVQGANFAGTCCEYHCAVGSGACIERGIRT